MSHDEHFPSLTTLVALSLRSLHLPSPASQASHAQSSSSSSSSAFLAPSSSTSSLSANSSKPALRRARSSRHAPPGHAGHAERAAGTSAGQLRALSALRIGDARVEIAFAFGGEECGEKEPESQRQRQRQSRTFRSNNRTHHDWPHVSLGVPLDAHGQEQRVSVALWLRRAQAGEREQSAEGGAGEAEAEAGRSGWQRIWTREIVLENLRRVDLNTTPRLPDNTLLLHFRAAGSEEVYALEASSSGVDEASSTASVSESDPHASPSSPPPSARPPQARKQSDVFARSLREQRMVPGVEIEEMQLLLEVFRAREEEGETTGEAFDEADRAWMEGDARLRLKRGELRERVARLKESREEEKEGAKSARTILLRRRELLARRRARLETARRGNVALRAEVASMETTIGSLEEKLADQATALHARRSALLSDLEQIYPIELLDASSLLFSINALALPNSDEPSSSSSASSSAAAAATTVDEETRASALGLVAQLVVLLSVYTHTPLHYPLATAGSRAVVQDGISCMSGPRAFPLYAKGVESYRFEYAVFLLNKNIEQLMNQHRVPVLDLRHTLGNLKNFLITVSSPAGRMAGSGGGAAAAASTAARRGTARLGNGDAATSTTTVRELKSGKSKNDAVPPQRPSEQQSNAEQTTAKADSAQTAASKKHGASASTSTTTSWTASLLGWRSAPAAPAPDPPATAATTAVAASLAPKEADAPGTKSTALAPAATAAIGPAKGFGEAVAK